VYSVAPTLVGTTHLLHLKARFNTFWFIKVILNKAPFTNVTEDDGKQLAPNDTWKSKVFHFFAMSALNCIR